ncbi:hypothetical protein HY339_01910 [Candidatus Gottesmanbacteria bacterium]|nr:hypothetical protein [Candidatus Gottesmanbacteria bacterium]
MKKISYDQLQKKYSGQLVALNKVQNKVVAVGKKIDDVFKKLQRKKLKPADTILVGPIQKAGSINVYISLSNKTH